MKIRSNILFNIFARILLITILLGSIAVVLPAYPVRADDAVWALQFDGTTDWIHLNKTVDIIGSSWPTTKSVNLWVKPASGANCVAPSVDAASCDVILGDLPKWWGITIGRIENPISPRYNQDCIWVWNTENDATGEDSVCIPYTPDEWVNIALVHSGGMLRGFKNGREVGSKPSGATYQIPGDPPEELYLGGLIYTSGDGVRTFAGQIDEVTIWNRALTATEIRDNMFINLALPQTGLMAYYKMSDGPTIPETVPPAPLTLTDDSGNGWSGTFLDGKAGAGYPGNGHYAQWVTSTAFVTPLVPAAPTGLTATAVSPFQINLSWIDNSDNETDFEIQRCTGIGCSDFSVLTFVPAGAGIGSTIDGFDTSASPRTEYCYHVHAVNAGGASAPTQSACAKSWGLLFLPMVRRPSGP